MSLDVTLTRVQRVDVYARNITHNLAQMADAAALYTPLWRPEELGITTAKELIPYLEQGLATLRAEPKTFKALNPPKWLG